MASLKNEEIELKSFKENKSPVKEDTIQVSYFEKQAFHEKVKLIISLKTILPKRSLPNFASNIKQIN